MADSAWIIVHVLDETTYTVHDVLHSEADLSEIHQYTPTGPNDPRAAAGVQTYVIQLNGSVHYLTDTFNDMKSALKAKAV